MCLENSSAETEKKNVQSFLKMMWNFCVLYYFSHQKTEGHDFEDTLNREENSEGCVQLFQDSVICQRSRIILE